MEERAKDDGQGEWRQGSRANFFVVVAVVDFFFFFFGYFPFFFSS